MKVLVICCVLLISPSIATQSTQPCELVSVEAVPYQSDMAVPVVFTALIHNPHVQPDSLKYKWRVSPGAITSGQGSSSITVNTVGLGGRTITATVDVFGLPAGSCSTASAIAAVMNEPSRPTIFDKYGDVSWQDEKSRLDEFAVQLKQQPSGRGAIIMYAGNPTYEGEAVFRLRRAKNYLVRTHGIASKILVTTDAGYDAELTTYLWIVPDGVEFPFAESKLPRSEIKFTKKKRSVR
jgi:PKD domain-containing protein